VRLIRLRNPEAAAPRLWGARSVATVKGCLRAVAARFRGLTALAADGIEILKAPRPPPPGIPARLSTVWSDSAPADQKRILMLDQEALEIVNARVGTHKMEQRKASTTMIRTSIMRAMHQVLDADPKILDDPLAWVWLKALAPMRS
jgi:hypothetical protein